MDFQQVHNFSGKTYPDSVCDHLDNGNYETIENKIQQTRNIYRTIDSQVAHLIIFFHVLLAGALSDKYGTFCAVNSLIFQ